MHRLRQAWRLLVRRLLVLLPAVIAYRLRLRLRLWLWLLPRRLLVRPVPTLAERLSSSTSSSSTSASMSGSRPLVEGFEHCVRGGRKGRWSDWLTVLRLWLLLRWLPVAVAVLLLPRATWQLLARERRRLGR